MEQGMEQTRAKNQIFDYRTAISILILFRKTQALHFNPFSIRRTKRRCRSPILIQPKPQA
jgi:hypothetical protein